MNPHKILKAHQPKYLDPIVLQAGQRVILGEEEKEEKWKGWIWAESATNQGWVPLQILEISPDKQTGTVREFYSARELNVEEGDMVEKIRSLNGWTWCRNLKTQAEGWIPDEVME